MYKIIIGFVLIAFGCNNGNAEKITIEQHHKSDGAAAVRSSDKPLAVEKKGNDQGTLYQFKNDTLLQTLTIIKYIAKQEISFELKSVNTLKGKTSLLTGIAKADLKQDTESDEDDEGNAYDAIEYHYSKNNCSISIRIAIDTKDKAKVLEYNCNQLHNNDCPFESVRVLKKLNKIRSQNLI